MMKRKPKPKLTLELSQGAADKLIAALNWYIARDKTGPLYVKAPEYFDAILAWHQQLPMAAVDRCAAIHEVCVGPGWAEGIGEERAANLPPAPKAPRFLWPFWHPHSLRRGTRRGT
jgi:hypothetical protein